MSESEVSKPKVSESRTSAAAMAQRGKEGHSRAAESTGPPSEPRRDDGAAATRSAYAKLKESEQLVSGRTRWSVGASRRLCRGCQEALVERVPFFTVLQPALADVVDPEGSVLFERCDYCEECFAGLPAASFFAHWRSILPAPPEAPTKIINLASLRVHFDHLGERIARLRRVAAEGRSAAEGAEYGGGGSLPHGGAGDPQVESEGFCSEPTDSSDLGEGRRGGPEEPPESGGAECVAAGASGDSDPRLGGLEDGGLEDGGLQDGGLQDGGPAKGVDPGGGVRDETPGDDRTSRSDDPGDLAATRGRGGEEGVAQTPSPDEDAISPMERLRYLIGLFLVRKRALKWRSSEGTSIELECKQSERVYRLRVPDQRGLAEATEAFEALFR